MGCHGVLLAVVLLVVGCRTGTCAKKPLPIMAINPGGSWVGLDRAMELAVNDINERDDILADYELQLYINHTNPQMPTQPNPGSADYIIYSNIYDGPARDMPFLLGGFYSEECETLCRTAGRFDIIEVSYGGVSPSLSDRQACPTFYRTVQSASQQNVPRLRLLQMYRWDRVAIIRYSNVLFTSVMDSLRDLLTENNISIVANEMFDHSPANHIRYLKERDARIIIGLFWDAQGRQVFCEAYKQGLYGARYMWILRGIGYFAPGWVTQEDPLVSCTAQEMIAATEGVVITNWQFLSSTEEESVTGRTPSNFVETYNAFAGQSSFGEAGSTTYDSALAAALVLNNSIEPLRLVNKTLEDYTYGDKQMRKIFMDVMDDLYFIGITGPISFLEDGDRVGQFQIEQLRDGRARTVGYYLSHDDKFEWIAGGIYFVNGEPPHDEIRRENRLVTISSPGFAIICSLCGLGILLACGLLIFNIAMRKQKIIKLSSPRINNLIILGSLMTYSSVILNGIDEKMVGTENMDHVCRAQLWTLALGFTLSFGSMFSKTWRVHNIFMNKKLEKRAVKDYQLVTMVSVFIVLESVYLGLWEIRPLVAVWDGYEAQATIEEDLMLVPVVQRCTRHGVTDITWLAAIYIFNGIQLVFGLFLAYETRKVTIVALNDSKNIGMSVYNVFILSCMGAVFSLLMDPLNKETVFIVTSVCVILSTTTTLLIIFTPKVIDVMRHPGGSTVSTMPTTIMPSVTAQSTYKEGETTPVSTITTVPAPNATDTSKNGRAAWVAHP